MSSRSWQLPREIRITPASDSDHRRGLLAYVRARFEAFVVDGITVRRTTDGRLEISYPARQSRAGSCFPHFLPTDPDWIERFEGEVLEVFRREARKG